jgi:drug/metabolite transporter (DMT)-like permease
MSREIRFILDRPLIRECIESGRRDGILPPVAPRREIEDNPPVRTRPVQLLVLLGGILAVSTASIFIRHAQTSVSSLTIAAGRLVFATLALAPFVLVRHRAALARLTARELRLAALAGLFLAAHFALWIASLERTTVASSVVLVTTTPLWVGLLSPLVLREPLTRRLAIGMALALAGGVIVGLGGADGTRAATAGAGRGGALLGDLMALSGAWMMAGYLMVGRRLRTGLTLVPYVFVVYGMAAVLLTVAMAATGRSLFGLAPVTYLWLVLLALVPQLLGHSSFNWALRYLPASFVAIALLGEPVGSGALAYGLLHEVPTPLELGGAALILSGIAVAALGAAPATAQAEL